jgi:RNA polymerase sigma-70 factor, ECF subfamily
MDFRNLSDKELYDMLTEEKSISEKAFSVLYDRYSARVWAYCLRFLGDKDAAKDIYQDTFMQFYRTADSGRVMTNVPAFLLRIARNKCLNSKAKEKNMIEYSETEHFSIDGGADNQELLDLIKKAIKKLPEDYKEAFILREYKCCSYQEIADLTDASLPTVKIRIFRAKQKLRELLSEYINEMSDN